MSGVGSREWVSTTSFTPAYLEHPALLYSGTDDFLAYMVPYVNAGLDADDLVFIAAREDNLAALREAVGPRGEAVLWEDTASWHPHPGTRARAFHELVTGKLEEGVTRFRLAGEPVWPEDHPDLTREWQRYESSLNRVLAPFPATLVCLYDAVNLDPGVVATARRTHPMVAEGAFESPSPEFEPPEAFLRHTWPSIAEPPPGAARLAEVTDLAAARRFLVERAAEGGLGAERAMDLALAANEAITNALMYGGGVEGVWAWGEDGRFLCQIEDRGNGIADPLASYLPPPPVAVHGRGLWIVRQLVDLLQIEPKPTGTVVRLHMTRA